jgi:transcriptional regulator with XRE-family HTH domain
VNDEKTKAFLKTFGKHLKAIREQKEISQEELALRADIGLNQVGRIERGEVNTSLGVIFAISNALEIDIAGLFRIK